MNSCCVIGLGYIGLPTALLLAEAGVNVIGVDINLNIIKNLNKGIIHINESGIDDLLKNNLKNNNFKISNKSSFADVFLVTVPTPFLKSGDINIPNLEYIYAAIDSIIPFLRKGNLVILESTVPVGTTELISEKILKECEFKKDDIFMAYCPERVLPGKIIFELKNNERIVGGINNESAQKGKQFYEKICKSPINVTDSKTAELVKLTENAFRDINIAFANELSLIADKLDIDIYKLISFTNNHPRVNVLRPGCGVGGHCIAVDPWFLISEFKDESKLLLAAREVNNNKPYWIIGKIEKYLDTLDNKSSVKIGIFGITYKPNVNDLRESPALEIAKYFINKYQVLVCDPNIKTHSNFKINSIKETIINSDLLIFLVEHTEFKKVNTMNKVIFDFCGILENE